MSQGSATSFSSAISNARVDEVSVLSPSENAAEPFAKVMLLEREAARTSSPALGSDRLAAGEVFYGTGQTIRRVFENAVIAVR